MCLASALLGEICLRPFVLSLNLSAASAFGLMGGGADSLCYGSSSQEPMEHVCGGPWPTAERQTELFCLSRSACLSWSSACTISQVGHRAIRALLLKTQ